MEEHRNAKGQRYRADGSQHWWFNGKPHREDGPAVIYANGTQEWWINGRRHREDGPAIINADGSQFWIINGEQYRDNDLPYTLNKGRNTMTLSTGEVVPMCEDDYEKYKYKPTGRFTKAALREI